MSEIKVTVIGGGPGGYPAAIRAARMGARVTLIENKLLGGTCLNRGCIPTKALLHSANMFYQTKRVATYGITTGEVTLNFPKTMEYKNEIVKTLADGLEFLVNSNGINIVKGTATFINPQTVRVLEANQEIKADKIIIATGSRPLKLPIKGADLPDVVTSDDALFLEKLPVSILIIGGGVIGIEFAQIFNRMNVEVTVVEMLPQIMPNEDSEVVAKLEMMLKNEGIEIYTNTTVEEIDVKGDKKIVLFGGKKKSVDLVLLAVGRSPYTEGLGANRIGLKMEKGTIAVNEYLETSVSDVFAVGDVIGNYMLAHVASAEGELAAHNALDSRKPMDYRAVPRALYTSPEMASVGFTEKEAKEKYGEVQVGRFPLYASGKALISGDTEGMVKVIAEPKSGEVLGVHILAPHATDLIAEAVLGIKTKASFRQFAHAIHAHPSFSESIMEAALDVDGSAIHIPPR